MLILTNESINSLFYQITRFDYDCITNTTSVLVTMSIISKLPHRRMKLASNILPPISSFLIDSIETRQPYRKRNQKPGCCECHKAFKTCSDTKSSANASLNLKYLSPVQRTSLFTAYWRNCEQQRTDGIAPLCYDPQASILLENFLDKKSEESLRRLDGSPIKEEAVEMLAVRSRFIDDFILAPSESRLEMTKPFRQLVLLGSGMDTRAYRLNMDKNWLVIEVDSDIDMLSWKHRVLENAKYKPTCKVASVEADISIVSQEWGSKIVNAGLKPELPSVWVLEGLMEYLNPDVHFNLFETVRQKCSPGSSYL